MLLLHQTGSVKIGEIVRYTVTYTPAHDRILPSPSRLFLKIKNTSAIALRAAFVHGPYTLYVAAYPSNFNPNSKFESGKRDGIPEFEPNLKAGGTFTTELLVPEDLRQSAGSGSPKGNSIRSVSWIVEVSSQVIFSNSAAVHYEILLGRDEKSLSLGSALTGGAAPTPGQVSDHQQSQGAKDGHHNAQPKGIYSKSISVAVEDTASLWNTPKMPEWGDIKEEKAAPVTQNLPAENNDGDGSFKDKEENPLPKPKRQKKIHLVVLTHGLHSNLGADMLFLKESIDAAAKQAKKDARARKMRSRKEAGENGRGETATAGSDDDTINEDDEEEEEEVIVRGFSGNAVRTERGIKYLGKRLARYVLQMTYPDQPYRPVTKKTAAESLSHALKPEGLKVDSKAAHHDSTILKEPYKGKTLAYKFTSISFIAHSLGGLVQTYAVAYIQKHSPTFFDVIEPINFIALATPFLGLSNENPLYVKFALDFGLVGRTGQDLGLTWRAPTIARSGWGAIVGGLGESAHKKIDGETAPEAKPLLRILPTGPAHVVLKKFRNRTVYSNVVNDGIVPLRTSCLLFLDWQGLGRVEKARRENGLIGTMAGWGWAEISGQNSTSPNRRALSDATSSDTETGTNTPTRLGYGGDVPQPPVSATDEDSQSLKGSGSKRPGSARPASATNNKTSASGTSASTTSGNTSSTGLSKNETGPLASFLGLFRPATSQSHNNDHGQPKQHKIYKRSQTLKFGDDSTTPVSPQDPTPLKNSKATAGDSDHEDFDRTSAPPKTTFFESAGDLLKPPLPPVEFLINPAARKRTIFHDRIYHPEDIPPPPLKKRPTFSNKLRRKSSHASGGSTTPTTPDSPHRQILHTSSSLSAHDYDDTKNTNPDKDPHEVVDGSSMKVEEKIARAYHRDLSWRKVLVRLEPDAHNNIIVRRMFANAYGWPVIKHLCDTHFSDSEAALTRDEDESNVEHAKDATLAPDSEGKETNSTENLERPRFQDEDRTASETREATDKVPAMPSPVQGSLGKALSGVQINVKRPSLERIGSESDANWSERDWADSEGDSDFDDGEAKKGGWNWTEAIAGKGASSPKGTDRTTIDSFLNNGLGLTLKGAPKVSSDATPVVDRGLEDALDKSEQTDAHKGGA